MQSDPATRRRPPLARILAIGDELVLGRTIDSNSAHLAQWLTDRGLCVERVTVVGDDEAGIVQALRRSAQGAALVICTGGLGPTDDDRTRQALARAARVPLLANGPAWRAISRFYRLNMPSRAVPESNRRQAMLPQGGQLIPNDRGTAPGMLLKLATAWVACLPGVPHEMQAMATWLDRRLARLVPGLRPPHLVEVAFAGMGESAAQDQLGGLLTAKDPQVGITVNEGGYITLRVLGERRQVEARAAELRRRLGAAVLPAASVAASLVSALTAAKATITTAESCTGGQVAGLLTAVPGASAVLREGVIAYHAEVKSARLGVTAAALAQGVVSEAVVRAMAEGARRRAKADLAIATTGIAGPEGGTAAVPVGTVWLAASGPRGTIATCMQVKGTRDRVQRRAAAHALVLAWAAWTGTPDRRPS